MKREFCSLPIPLFNVAGQTHNGNGHYLTSHLTIMKKKQPKFQFLKAWTMLLMAFFALGTANAQIPYLAGSGTTHDVIVSGVKSAAWSLDNTNLGTTSGGYYTVTNTNGCSNHWSTVNTIGINNNSLSYRYLVAQVKLRAGKTSIGSTSVFDLVRDGYPANDNNAVCNSTAGRLELKNCPGFAYSDADDVWLVIDYGSIRTLLWTRMAILDPGQNYMIKHMYLCTTAPTCPVAIPDITADQTGITQTSTGDIGQNSTDNLLSNFRINSTGPAQLNSLSFAAGGDFATGDVSNFKLYASTGNTFPGGSPITGGTFNASGIGSGGTVTFSGLSRSLPAGATYFFITADIPSGATLGKKVRVPATPTLNFASVGTFSNTIGIGGEKTIVPPIPPVIDLNHTSITQTTAGNVSRSTTDNILSNFRATVNTSNAVLNSLSFVAGGSFATGTVTNFKLYTNTTNVFPGGSALSTVSAGAIASGGTVTFSGLTQSCPKDNSTYFWITADISASATAGSTISVPATPTVNFALGTPTNNVTAGGTKTVVLSVTYYSKNGSNNGRLESSWGTNAADGTGTAPPNFTSGDKFVIRSGTTITVSGGTWTVNGGPDCELNINGTLSLSSPIVVGGAFNFNTGGTFTHGAQSVTLGTNGSIGGTNTGTPVFADLIINTTNNSDIVYLNRSRILIQQSRTLFLTKGIFNVGASNVIQMGEANGNVNINATGGGNFATTGANGGEDGGNIDFRGTSGHQLIVTGTGTLGSPTFYNIYTGHTDANWRLTLSSANIKINGTLSNTSLTGATVNSSNQWVVNTNSPVYGPNSTLVINRNNQGYSPGNEWNATSGYIIGTTPGYPNNVTIANVGTSGGNVGGVSVGLNINSARNINGTLTVGTPAVSANVGISSSSFVSGGIVVNNNSNLGAATSFRVNGNWLRQGTTIGNFVATAGITVTFGGNGTSGSPQTIGLSTGTETFANSNANIAIANGTYVKLNSPVTLGTARTLTLTSGILETDPTNILSITNTAAAAITGAGIGSGSYINGPVSRSLAAGSTTYTFPTGAATTYLPLTLNSNTGANVATVRAFAANAGGTAPANSVLSTTEYWSMSTTSNLGNASSTVTVSRPSGTANFIAISKTSANGSYANAGGSVSGGGTSGTTGNTASIGAATPWFFAFASNTYAITASAGANGSISPAGVTNVISGASQAYTITPDAGYHIEDVLVDGVSNPTAVSNGSHTFSNVTATHTISATFAPNCTGYTWTNGGGDYDWDNADNWACGVVPPGGETIAIEAGKELILLENRELENIQFGNGAQINLFDNILTINGTLSGNGTFVGSALSGLVIASSANAGTLNFASADIDGYTPEGGQVLKSLVVNSDLTLGTALDITAGNDPGVVIVNSGATLITGGHLTLKSNAGGTAAVGPSAGTISGNVTVERYIPASRQAWRQLS
ncbi:MAG TPA: hypothetical protein PKC39_15580, partial [Ferruginibacter sp.]|nr:hypothetical protein [Ferruginibacter sp.]HMP22380.1 hypothetical protein [Ferruginibacter sp.]